MGGKSEKAEQAFCWGVSVARATLEQVSDCPVRWLGCRPATSHNAHKWLGHFPRADHDARSRPRHPWAEGARLATAVPKQPDTPATVLRVCFNCAVIWRYRVSTLGSSVVPRRSPCRSGRASASLRQRCRRHRWRTARTSEGSHAPLSTGGGAQGINRRIIDQLQ